MKASEVLKAARAAYRQPTTITELDAAKIAVHEVVNSISDRARAYVIITEGDLDLAIQRAEFDEEFPNAKPEPAREAA